MMNEKALKVVMSFRLRSLGREREEEMKGSDRGNIP